MHHGLKYEQALLHDALQRGDPFADAAMREVESLGTAGKALMEKGIRCGVSAVPDAPDGIKALLSACAEVSARAGHAALKEQSEAFLSIPPAWFKLALRC